MMPLTPEAGSASPSSSSFPSFPRPDGGTAVDAGAAPCSGVSPPAVASSVRLRAVPSAERLGGALLPALVLAVASGSVVANPEGGEVVMGEATISGEGTSTVRVMQTSERALIDWERFSIGEGERTRFEQPGVESVVANRVVGVEPTQVLGTLEANGRVVLMNRHGVVFGPGSRVDSAGLVATVHDLELGRFESEGRLRFVGGGMDAEVGNAGEIDVGGEGLVALVGPRVRNEGTIRGGRVSMLAAGGFALDWYGDGMLRFAPGDVLGEVSGEGALVDVGGRVEGDAVRLGAHAVESLVSASVNVSGVVRARRVERRGGEIRLEGGDGEVRLEPDSMLDASGEAAGGLVVIEAGRLVSEGEVLVEGGAGKGGTVELRGGRVGLGGRVSATGSTGGEVRVESGGLLSLGEGVEARGIVGKGGEVRYAAGRVVEISGAVTDVSGETDGGGIGVEAKRYASSGSYRAVGMTGAGGHIDLEAREDVRLLSASLEASGARQGGRIRIGGSGSGGASESEAMGTVRETFVNDGTEVDVSSSGVGGTVIVDARERATFLGGVDARGGAGGGLVELTSSDELRHGSMVGVQVGDDGVLVLGGEGTRTVEGGAQEAQGWAYAGVLGLAHPTTTGATAATVADTSADIDVGALERYDAFGVSVSLNATGDRLAVGAWDDDGADDRTENAGAVYLFTFVDTVFTGGTLAATLGKGYAGGHNVDVTALEQGDAFGASVSLNAAGDRLAVGAWGDDGADDGTTDAGAVYLFTFADTVFTGGTLAATLGKGDTGGANVDVARLEQGDAFGTSVSLSATGDRLAVGAWGDDGADNGTTDAGAVSLFTFTDTSFTGGTLAATLGKGDTGEHNVDVTALEQGDAFGASVSLSAAGDRLAVGAWGDDGADNGAEDAGAVSLFIFADTAFTGGALAATLGKGDSEGRNVDVTALGQGDAFGASVSLNAKGDGLAVGAPKDASADNRTADAGAVYLFTFADMVFSDGALAATLERANGFGRAVSLNAAGDRLAVGAFGDDGLDNWTNDAGAVYLFTFIDTVFTGGRRAATVGKDYAGGRDAGTLEHYDYFGRAVSLNAAGDRLAVGVWGDDDASNGTRGAGAVYLFTFTDTVFSDGTLAATLGKGYTGGRNVDIKGLDQPDQFGTSVSLNAAGDRLAVGTRWDDGATHASNEYLGSGAVHLFAFTDTDFTGGALAATVGKGYTGGRNVDVTTLGYFDEFGGSVSLNAAGDRLAVSGAGAVYLFTFTDTDPAFSGGTLAATLGLDGSVSLNAAGDRLAVGASGDDGADNGTRGAGAVHLFTFTDTAFSGGTRVATVGKGYTGGHDVDVPTLERLDNFGSSVSLNARGDRLAVGASGDDGADNGTPHLGRLSSGAVYLFTFADADFTGGTLAATLGKGYTGGHNIDVPTLGQLDFFGGSVSLNAAGDRLAVGASGDDSADNGTRNAGAVYLFTFADTDFTGGTLAATLGESYSGGRNVDVTTRERDRFGASVSLSAAGDRLAVGARGDDGTDSGTDSVGAVYLFTFTDTAFSGGTLAATLGEGYTAGRNVDVTALGQGDGFGASVSLNAKSDRLAVGASGDDGADNGTRNAGAVYLFTFADTAFSGGTLAATLGEGYTGGRNVDVAALKQYDQLGRSVSLNAAGDRLAVGARWDDGASNGTENAGAVYLLTFADADFTGGTLAATLGKGYTAGRNVDVTALGQGDGFGASVSLNAGGDRLAVGAWGDDGADDATADAGAVYLFTFADTAFSGGTLAATLGEGYTAGHNVDVTALERSDAFGTSVSLNARGDRLAVGASGDDGVDDATEYAGAVHLFTFADAAFTGGTLAATLGKGYTGGRNVDVATLEQSDAFGTSVSLNAGGDRLAVGVPGDDGWGNLTENAGALYLFTLTDDPVVFSGGALAATLGKGYFGGRNVDVAALGQSDGFGASVSLNAAGDRLAVGAPWDDGPKNGTVDTGAVYLFTFTDTAFSGGTLVATLGKGYTGGHNVDVAALGQGDGFGASVSLDAEGDRLAVGAWGDDGANNGMADTGAVYLFTFADTDTAFTGGTLAATLGKGDSAGRNVDVAALGQGDAFGASVSLNEGGDGLAVGAPWDDGPKNGTADTGAVYLFTFADTDTAFTGGTLAATLGKGYTGGHNVDVTALERSDVFGASVSLNAKGDRLAVGAWGDDGADRGTDGTGAVYLLTFADTAFTGGALAATLGKGDSEGRNVDVTALGQGDAFGASVSLNAKGDRLAVGARGDDGADNGTADAGAVYLFTFTDIDFSSGTLAATVGKGDSGVANVDVATLEWYDALGASVSLNAAGNRLVVGASGDDGWRRSRTENANAGAVYLFTFADTDFSGAALSGMSGKLGDGETD